MHITVLSILLGCVCYYYGRYKAKCKITKMNTALLSSRLRAINANMYEIAKIFNIKLGGYK